MHVELNGPWIKLRVDAFPVRQQYASKLSPGLNCNIKMVSGRHSLSPTDVPAVFSALIGIFTVRLVHSHNIERLIEVNLAWLAWLGLIYLRAKMNGGKILNHESGLYYGFAVAHYLLGLLMACVYYLVYFTG
jgi:hypothetical protein